MYNYKKFFESKKDHIEIERDRILDKISSNGIESLSKYEKEFLDSFKSGKTSEIYDKEYNQFEDESFKFYLKRIESYHAGRKYYGKMIFKDYDQEIEGAILETIDGRIISYFSKDDRTDFDVINYEDYHNYESFLEYIADSLRERN